MSSACGISVTEPMIITTWGDQSEKNGREREREREKQYPLGLGEEAGSFELGAEAEVGSLLSLADGEGEAGDLLIEINVPLRKRGDKLRRGGREGLFLVWVALLHIPLSDDLLIHALR